eukprot:5171954-Heterocapsa_arctica.AAC.1
MLVLLRARCAALKCARWCHDNLISDHAPVQASLQWVPPTPSSERPIPKFICKHPTFGIYHDKLCIAANLDNLPVVT